MKKALSFLLAALMLLSAMPVFAETDALPSMTTEEITLTFTTRELPYELLRYQADKFEEAYPNIKVEVLTVDFESYGDTMNNLATEKNLPDVLGLTWAPDAIANGWLINLDEYLAKDPDAAKISASIKECNAIDGQIWYIPSEARPAVAILNKTLFEKYNVELPDYDWTYDDFVEVVEAVAHPEDYCFGYPDASQMSDMFVPNWGWNGTAFTFNDEWAAIVEKYLEWTANGVSSNNMTAEEKTSVLGAADADVMATGHAAVYISQQYGSYDYINGVNAEKSGCEFVFYPVPDYSGVSMVEQVNCGISATCKYPREAWELTKWMGWGAQATINRSEYYKQTGELDLTAPVVVDDDVRAVLVENAPEALKPFYAHMRPIYSNATGQLPGGLGMILTYYFGDWPGKISRGEYTVAEVAEIMRAEAVKAVDATLEACRKVTGK